MAYPSCPVCGDPISRTSKTIARDAAIVHGKCRDDHENKIDEASLESETTKRIEERIAALENPADLIGRPTSVWLVGAYLIGAGVFNIFWGLFFGYPNLSGDMASLLLQKLTISIVFAVCGIGILARQQWSAPLWLLGYPALFAASFFVVSTPLFFRLGLIFWLASLFWFTNEDIRGYFSKRTQEEQLRQYPFLDTVG